MAKLPKLVLRTCKPGSSEWIKLFKFILLSKLFNLKFQYIVLETDNQDVIFPTLEFSKEKVVFFDPNAALRFLNRENVKLNTKQDLLTLQFLELETSLFKQLVQSNNNSEDIFKRVEEIIDNLQQTSISSKLTNSILLATIYSLATQNPEILSKFTKLHSWFTKELESEYVKESLILINDLEKGIVPSLPVEESEEVKVVVGDETMRKVKEGVALPPRPTEAKLPIPGEENILITSALPYVNNVPHLGNLIGSILSADVYARFLRITGVNYLYICGTDEYGTATETKALEEGISCQALCDKYNALHRQVYEHFQIDFDHFGRTTTSQQTEIAQDIFFKIYDNKFTLEESMTQLYCEQCSRFLADRFVEGTCPKCKYHDARGDQCDACGSLLNAADLVNPRCKLDGNSPISKDSTHIFLDLPQLQPQLEQWVDKVSEEGRWTSNGKQITNSWLKEGLKNRCITRDLKWGTPVPLEHMKDKVFYVWYDAPIGYPSITANYTKDWEKWWKNPDQVKLYQFMGKDNVPFHTVIFPAILMGTKQPWTLLHHINTTEYLNYEDGKFSKSRNVGVFGTDVKDTGIPISVWRYYLLSVRPETNDSIFTWKEFISKNNGELLANFGNFCNRILKFLASPRYLAQIPEFNTDGTLEAQLVKDVNQLLDRYLLEMKAGKLRTGLKTLMETSQLGNQYLQQVKIDNNLFVNHRQLCNNAVGTAVNLVYLLAAMAFPFIPETSHQLSNQLNAPLAKLTKEWDPKTLLPGHVIGKPDHLFSRIDEKLEEVYRNKYGGKSN